MSEPDDDGGAAFPTDGDGTTSGGMTLRDWFAGQAIIGCGGWPGTGAVDSADEAATFAYAVADALLKARAR
jgi:hypothetical protein